ncbi:ABC transporter substrate-binding protein [Marinobacter salarius]|uniref:Putative ABC transporter substrate-binding lipoprotein YhfQ n=1 Tax=Marinobacter salarius TaxID=1420917 RepID=A0A1W6KBL4_9GAMM|nr:ABC transporter substrate-binding protein [Marinobacter salarius]ARM84813.1 putative ABC transporter substrate-binding lipoprotein YhfQ [Marinobacter salarius]
MACLRNRIAKILLVVLLSPASGWAQDENIRLTDDRGETLRLSTPAVRPAAISTFGADVALALDTPPVAVTDYGLQGVPDYLASRLDGVTGLGPRHQPNLEVLSSVRPDLVIAIRRYTEKDGDQIEAIAPMLALDLITVQDSLRGLELAGQALGAPAKASALNTRFRDRVQLLADRNKPEPAETVALLTSGSETPFVYYDHFLPTALLERLGFDNVGGQTPNPDSGIPLGYRISLEALLELNPDTILLLPTSRQRAFTMNPIWPYLKAVRTDQVYEVPHYWKEGAGPIARERILDDIQRLLLTSEPDK